MRRSVILACLVAVCTAPLLADEARAQVCAVNVPHVHGQWVTLPYQMPLNPISASLMHTGQVLLVPGSENDANNYSTGAQSYRAAVWDPTGTDASSIVVQNVDYDLFCSGTAVLADGRPLVIGGTASYSFTGENRATFFDPATGGFAPGPTMADGRWYGTSTVLGDGRVMVLSGLDLDTGATNNTVEIYDLADAGSGWSTPATAPFTPPLYPRMALLPNGRVFYSGHGSGSSNATSWIFDPALRTWTASAPTTRNRSYGSTVLLPLLSPSYTPRVMNFGGGNPATNTTDLIDLSLASPTYTSGPPMSTGRIQMNAVLLPDGTVLALGGSVSNEVPNAAGKTADLYLGSSIVRDPEERFTSAGTASFSRLYHSTALLLPDARVMVIGSNPGSRGDYEPAIEVYSPAYLFDASDQPVSRPTIAGIPAGGVIGYGAPFAVNYTSSTGISAAVLVRPGSSTHAVDMEQRLVGLCGPSWQPCTGSAGTLNLLSPPNGSVAPPGYYMLFLLDSAGVPSTARFIRLTSNTAAPPDGAITTPAADVTIAAGGTVSFATTTSAAKYAWVLPGGNPATSTAKNPGNITFGTAGTYVASLTVIDANGNSDPSPPTRTITVTPTSSDFSIAVGPASRVVRPGQPATFTVTVTPKSGFTGSVSLSVSSESGFPAGVTSGGFSPTSIAGSGSSTLTMNTTTAALPFALSLTIKGTSGSRNHTASTTLLVVLQPPASLTATPGPSQVSLSWPVSVGASGYRVKRASATGGPYIQAGCPTATSFVDTGLADGTTYFYVVSATYAGGPNGGGESADSVETSAATPSDTQPPSAPSNLTASAFGATQIGLAWAAATDNVGVTGYRIERCPGSTCTNFVQIAAPGATPTSFSDTTVAASTSYRYRTRAFDGTNLGPYSNVASATTPAPPDTQAPSAPGSLTATAVGPTQIDLGWVAATDDVGVTGYRVERCQGTGCSNFSQIGTAGAAATSFSDTAAAGSTSYRYRVRAVDAVPNLGAYSNVATATTPAGLDTEAPSAPSNLGATAAGATQIDLGWTPATDNVGVTGYRIERCLGDGCSNFAEIAAAAATSFSDATPAAATSYSYRVRAIDAAANLGGYSNVASTTTLAASSNLVAAYAFGEGTGVTVADASGNGNIGTISNATWTTAGKFGNALVFNGSNAVVTVGGSASLDLTTGMTLEAWVNPSQVAPAWRDVIYKGNASYFLAATSPPAGSISALQTTGRDAGTVTADTLNFATPNAAGNLIAVVVRVGSATTNPVVTDSRGNTFALAGSQVQSADPHSTFVFYARNIAAGPNSVSVSLPAAVTLRWVIVEYAGLDPVAPLDQVASAQGTSASPNSGSVSTTSARALVLGAVTTGNSVTFTPGTGFALRNQAGGKVMVEDQSVQAAGSYAAPGTLSASNKWAGIVVTFKAAAGVAAGGSPGTGGTFAGATATLQAPAALPVNTWTHLAATHDGSTLTLYVDGTAVATRPAAGALTTSTNALQIGGDSVVGQFFQGTIDEVRIYNVARSQAQIQSDMATAILAPPDTQPPTAPSNLSATAFSATQINLAWTAATDNVGVTSYLIERCQGAGCSNFAQVGTATGTSYSNTGLAPSTSYRYRVRASDGPNLGPYSNVASATTDTPPDSQPPTAPGNLTATAFSQTQINLTWTAATDNVGVAGYRIERCQGAGCSNFAQVGTTGAVTSYSDASVAAATNYTYRVRAVDAIPNPGPYSNFASATTPDTQAPTAPSNLAATAFSATQINLAWTAATDNVAVTGYRVERCQGPGCSNFVQIATPGAAATSFSDTTVTASTSYSYRVRASDGPNFSPYSNVAGATTPAAPDTQAPTAPTNLTATAFSATRVDLIWTAATDNVAVTGYRVERCQGTGCSNFVEIAAPNPVATSFADAAAAAGTSYRYRVRASDGSNLGAYSNVASATTPSAPDTEPPGAPGNLTATAINSGQINLSWAPATDNVAVTGYRVERCQGAGCSSFTEVGTTTGATTYASNGLAAGTSYTHRVRAFDGTNLGAYSNVASATTLPAGSDTQPPTAPGNLNATAASSSRINLTWAASTDNVGVTQYLVERCQGSTCTNFAQIATTTSTSFASTGLSRWTTYRYRVRAVDAAANLSPYSNIASTRTRFF